MTDAKIIRAMLSTLDQLLDEDETRIYYRPTFVKIAGSVTAAILLERMRWYWRMKGKEPFYKFNAPCEHEKYRVGDSWQEELHFDRGEFDGARRRIATRIEKGMKKQNLLSLEGNDGVLRSSDFIVLYWRDSDNLMWYQVNENLLKAHIIRVTNPLLADVEILHYLRMQESDISQVVQDSSNRLSAESTTKRSNQKKTPPNGDFPILQSEEESPDPATPVTPKVLTEKQAAREALNEAVWSLLGGKLPYDQTGKWVNFLTGRTPEKGKTGKRNGEWFNLQVQPGMSADEIGAMGRWYRDKSKGKDIYASCENISLEAARFRADPRHDGMVERVRLDREAREDLVARQASGGDAQPQPDPEPEGQYNPDVAERFAAMVQAVGNKLAAGGNRS